MKQAFTHRIRIAESVTYEFLMLVKPKDIEHVFPKTTEAFERLIVEMFTRHDVREGQDWDYDNYDCFEWYGLSWGCIHYHALYSWFELAHAQKWQCVSFITRKFFSLCRLCAPPERLTRDEQGLMIMSFTVDFPVSAFSDAVDSMVRNGYLEQIDGMYFPTNKLIGNLTTAVKHRENDS